jgi:hypothetical protein
MTAINVGKDMWEAVVGAGKKASSLGNELARLHQNSCPHRREDLGRAPNLRNLTGRNSSRLCHSHSDKIGKGSDDSDVAFALTSGATNAAVHFTVNEKCS